MYHLPHGLDIYLVNVQTMRKIVQMFVAFSEKLNFTILEILWQGGFQFRDLREAGVVGWGGSKSSMIVKTRYTSVKAKLVFFSFFSSFFSCYPQCKCHFVYSSPCKPFHRRYQWLADPTLPPLLLVHFWHIILAWTFPPH